MTPKRAPDGTITNASELTVNEVAMQSVLCPSCGIRIFNKWPLGWDGHAASPHCTGLTATSEKERKTEFKTRNAHLFRRARRA